MYLIFDIETTGLPDRYDAPITDLDNWPRMVQIAWGLFDEEGEELDRNDLIIKPEGYKIPKEAASVHGITTGKAIREGVSLRKAFLDYSSRLDKAKTLVAHNISFDVKVIGAEFIRKGVKNNLSDIRKICTMRQATNFCEIPNLNFPGQYKWPTLSELYFKLFNTRFKEAHNAAIDVQACIDCFFELKKRDII